MALFMFSKTSNRNAVSRHLQAQT